MLLFVWMCLVDVETDSSASIVVAAAVVVRRSRRKRRKKHANELRVNERKDLNHSMIHF